MDRREIMGSLLRQYAEGELRDLFVAVRELHCRLADFSNVPKGHGWDHDVEVAVLAAYFADDMQIDDVPVAKLAFAAGLLHSLDRALETGVRESETYEEWLPVIGICYHRELETGTWHSADLSNATELLVEHYLRTCVPSMPSAQMQVVMNAIARHAQKNRPDHDAVTVCLQDADRVAGLNLSTTMRNGNDYRGKKFVSFCYLNKVHPDSTYNEPHTQLCAIHYTLEWADPGRADVYVRTSRARQMAQERAIYIRQVIALMEGAYREVGLLDNLDLVEPEE